MADDLTPDQIRAMLAASGSLLGRFQGPEQLDLTTFALNGNYTSRPLNLTRPIESLMIYMAFRITVTVAPYASISPEAPQNLLQQIIVNGQHKDFGGITPINISGATAFQWPHLFQQTGCDCIINGVRQPDAGRPFLSSFAGNVATYDVVLCYTVPFGPMLGLGSSAKRTLTNFLMQPLDWNDSLRVQLRFGDASALGDPTGATVALGAFGTGAGTTGTMGIYANYSILGDFQNQMRTGVVIRNENFLTQFVANGNQQRLTDLQHQITSNVVVKSGTTQATGLTAGVTTFAALSDVQLEQTQIVVDNKPVRNNTVNLLYKAYQQRMMNGVIPEGYFVESFIESQNPLTAYRGDGLPGGSQFSLFSNIIAATANSRQNFVQEYILGGPFPAQRRG